MILTLFLICSLKLSDGLKRRSRDLLEGKQEECTVGIIMKHIHKGAIGDTLTFNFEIPDVISDRGVRAAANITICNPYSRKNRTLREGLREEGRESVQPLSRCNS